MKTYNKLVRDKIPEIINNQGQKAKLEVMEPKEYYKALVKKLDEEVKEFMESDEVEEIADILEVLNAILKYKDVSQREIENIKQKKFAQRGGFEKRIFLVGVEE